MRRPLSAMVRGVLCSVVAMLFFAEAASGEYAGMSGSSMGHSRSLGAFRAPAHEQDRGWGLTDSSEVRSEPAPSIRVKEEVGTASYFFHPRNGRETADGAEGTSSWRGYLSEKGPSRVIVEVKVEQEIQPLPQEVWDLIMGENPDFEANSDMILKKRVVGLDRNAITIPNKQIDKNVEMASESDGESAVRIHKEENEEASAITDDAAESYQQLMELFNRPVFATPSIEFGDSDEMLSFQSALQQSMSSTVRDGSQARFEIRR